MNEGSLRIYIMTSQRTRTLLLVMVLLAVLVSVGCGGGGARQAQEEKPVSGMFVGEVPDAGAFFALVAN